MAGRPTIIRKIKSYINSIDAHSASGPMKTGLPPKVGVTHYYWRDYQVQCPQRAGAPKKSYDNMVFLNLNSASTPCPSAFTPTCNYNYFYLNKNVAYYDAQQKYRRHYYRPYFPV